MASWICEECGYENTYDDIERITVCECCGEPAADRVKAEAASLLDRQRAEEKRRLRAAEKKRRAEEEKEKADKIRELFAGLHRLVHKLMTAAVILSVNVVAVWFAANALSSGTAIDNFSANCRELPVKGSMAVIRENVGEWRSGIYCQADDNGDGAPPGMRYEDIVGRFGENVLFLYRNIVGRLNRAIRI